MIKKFFCKMETDIYSFHIYNKNLNNIHMERATYQKHLGIILDEKLNFKQHVDNAILKTNKGIAVIKKTLS